METPFFAKAEKIVLRKDGTWESDGIEITHEGTRELFYRSICWDALERKYYLKVGLEKMYIEVEEAPFFVTSIVRKRASWLRRNVDYRAKLADGRELLIQPDRLRYQRGHLYLELGEGMRAKFLSSAYYDLLSDLEEDERSYYIRISGEKVELAEKDEFHGAATA